MVSFFNDLIESGHKLVHHVCVIVRTLRPLESSHHEATNCLPTLVPENSEIRGDVNS